MQRHHVSFLLQFHEFSLHQMRPSHEFSPHLFEEFLQVSPKLHKQEFQPDRKSTRLNSSHVSISYAVFCLKKKSRRAPRPIPLPSRPRCPPSGGIRARHRRGGTS